MRCACCTLTTHAAAVPGLQSARRWRKRCCLYGRPLGCWGHVGMGSRSSGAAQLRTRMAYAGLLRVGLGWHRWHALPACHPACIAQILELTNSLISVSLMPLRAARMGPFHDLCRQSLMAIPFLGDRSRLGGATLPGCMLHVRSCGLPRTRRLRVVRRGASWRRGWQHWRPAGMLLVVRAAARGHWTRCAGSMRRPCGAWQWCRSSTPR
jgi:hypothetical protein